MSIVVQKYGGSSVANPDKLREVARRIMETKSAGHDVAVVVSAMGKTTDELLRLAQQKGIAIYARATASPPLTGESFGDGTVIRKDAPPPPGSVCGVASEKQIFLLQAAGVLPEELLAFLDEQEAPWKQFQWEDGGTGRLSLVLSLENLHHRDVFREELNRRFGGRVTLESEAGAVSAIGAGINQTSRNLLEGTTLLRKTGAAPLQINTSSFRISWIIPSAAIPTAVQALHRHFLETAG